MSWNGSKKRSANSKTGKTDRKGEGSFVNERNKQKPPVNLGTILIRAAAVLFILTMISVYLLGGLFARYVSTGQGGDSARVAGFDVRVTGPGSVNVEVSTEDPARMDITLDNRSEVAVSYSVRVDAGAPDYGLAVRLGDRTIDTISQGPVLDFGTVGYMAVGGAAGFSLSFTPVDWDKITQAATGLSVTVTQDYTVYIDVVQVD